MLSVNNNNNNKSLTNTKQVSERKKTKMFNILCEEKNKAKR